MEILEAFELTDQVLAEAYQVNEVCFWGPDPHHPDKIVRTGRILDTNPDVSEMPHVTLNQARLLAILRNYIRRASQNVQILYGYHVESVNVDNSNESRYPVVTAFRSTEEKSGNTEVRYLRSRYAVGCDGARSAVRRAIGQDLTGDVSDTWWGVMDILGVTDFPDIRMKCVIKSAAGTNILIIPREGGHLVRLYVELDPSEVKRETELEVTPEYLINCVNQSLNPYSFQLKQVGWWSQYKIGQRLCKRFDDLSLTGRGGVPRIFLAGDACHTHSAKAGQGMNVAIADAWNIGWKIGSVVTGRSRAELLLTYSQERQAVAKRLIEFDKEFSHAMSTRASIGSQPQDSVGENVALFQRYFAEQILFTSGTDTCYEPSLLVSKSGHQSLAKGFPIGKRFHSTQVIRLADALRLHLGHVIKADGAWRLFLFADRKAPGHESRFYTLCGYLASEESILKRVQHPDDPPDRLLDVRAVFQQSHKDVNLELVPEIMFPRKGKFGLKDYEKVFCAIPGDGDIFDLRGIDRNEGCMVVVRPDQVVAHVLPLDGVDELVAFFKEILIF